MTKMATTAAITIQTVLLVLMLSSVDGRFVVAGCSRPYRIPIFDITKTRNAVAAKKLHEVQRFDGRDRAFV
jgi:hypothetical protein